MSLAGVFGAIVDLNNPAHVLHWHFIQLSVSNVVVIGLMFIVFALAIVLPLPGAARRQAARRAAGPDGTPSGIGNAQ